MNTFGWITLVTKYCIAQTLMEILFSGTTRRRRTRTGPTAGATRRRSWTTLRPKSPSLREGLHPSLKSLYQSLKLDSIQDSQYWDWRRILSRTLQVFSTAVCLNPAKEGETKEGISDSTKKCNNDRLTLSGIWHSMKKHLCTLETAVFKREERVSKGLACAMNIGFVMLKNLILNLFNGH